MGDGTAATGRLRAETLATPRLRLDPLTAADAPAMAEVLGDPAMHAFTGGEPLDADALAARYVMLEAGSPVAGEEWLNWIVRLDGQPVGYVQATITGADRPTADVAWVVGTAWQGRGIATEATGAMCDWLRDRGVAQLSAAIHPDHIASARVAERAGLSPTDEIDDGETVWRDAAAPT